MSIKYNGVRWHQVLYALIGAYAAGSLISSGLMTQYNDIDFTGTYLDQYHSLTADVAPHVATNAVLLGAMTILGVTDLFSITPSPVWFEMSWSLIFGIIQVVNIVITSRDYPKSHCTLTPAITPASSFSRRDSPSPIGILNDTPANQVTIITNAAQGVCQTWSAMFVFDTMAAISMLLLVFGWWAVVGLRHRRSHPNFFLDPVPQPLKWELSSESATAPQRDIETASVTSTAVSRSSMDDEKKVGLEETLARPPMVMVHLEKLQV
ncbi:hypothetical protein FRB98_002472 [Tulasnella sp. 332]|nr:hypothetical protein FRB98_002472 [Tulasnella sp. 332]